MKKFFIVISVFVILFVFFVYPFGKLFLMAFTRENNLSLLNFVDIFRDRHNISALWHTLFVGITVTVISVITGSILSWLVTRTDIHFKNFFTLALLVPYMIPPFISAFAWMQLIGPVGYVNKIIMALFKLDEPILKIYGVHGIILVSSIYTYPLVYIAITNAFQKMDSSFEEAARVSGARVFRVLRDITIPVMLPAIGGASIIVFVTSVSMFGIPAILGIPKGYLVLTTKIFMFVGSYGTKYNFNLASAMSMILISIGVTSLLIQNYFVRKERFAVITGKSTAFSVIELHKFRLFATVIVFVFFIMIVVAPIVAVIITAITKALGLHLKASNLTIKNFHYILFKLPIVWRAIRNSLFLSITVSTVTSFMAILFIFLERYTEIKGRKFIDYIVSAPYAIPGTVIGLSMILAWIKPIFGISIYNTIWIIMIAYIARFMIFPMRTVKASAKQIDNSLIEAARISGANQRRMVQDILFPLIKPGVFSGWFLVFMPALTELTLSILLYSAGKETIGVTVYNMTQEGLILEASALAVIIIFTVLFLNIAIRKLSKGKIGAI